MICQVDMLVGSLARRRLGGRTDLPEPEGPSNITLAK